MHKATIMRGIKLWMIEYSVCHDFPTFVPHRTYIRSWEYCNKKKLHGLSLQANYIDRLLPAKLVPNLGFLERNRSLFFQVAPQLYSRGWVDPVKFIILICYIIIIALKNETPPLFQVKQMMQEPWLLLQAAVPVLGPGRILSVF
jgi:hypothetical protein